MPRFDAVVVAGDCDDADPRRWSGAPEVCGDGVVNDCDLTERPATCRFVGRNSLADAAARLRSTVYRGQVGYDVAGVGDLDGDGADDILVGGRNFDEEGGHLYGTAWVILGPMRGVHPVPEVATTTLLGIEESEAVGRGVSGAGDVNGDGGLDVLVLGWGPSLVTDPLVGGAVPLQSAATASMASGIGWQDAEGLGDLDGDGFDEFMASYSTPDATDWRGRIGVYFGPVEGEVSPESAGSTLPFAMAAARAGDVDADGIDDVLLGHNEMLVSEEHRPGSAFLFTELRRGLHLYHEDANARVDGEQDLMRWGNAVDGAGDLDADGYDDIIISALASEGWVGREDQPLAAGVFYGPLAGHHWASQSDARFTLTEFSAGDSVLGAGDLDGDGFDDVLIGDAGVRDDNGFRVGGYDVFYGPVWGEYALDEADATFVGEEGSGISSGYVMSRGGDIDGDGRPDLLFGAPDYCFYEGDALFCGTAYVVYGGAL